MTQATNGEVRRASASAAASSSQQRQPAPVAKPVQADSPYSPTSTLSPTALLSPQCSPSSPEGAGRRLIIGALRAASTGSRPLIGVHIPSYRVVEGLPVYELHIYAQNGLRWMIARRFNELYRLNQSLERSVRNVDALPPFPQKEWIWTDPLRPDILDSRLALLDNYLRKVSQSNKLRAHAAFIAFLRPNDEDLMEENDDGSAAFIARPTPRQQRRSHSPVTYRQPYNGDSNSASPDGSQSRLESVFEPRSYDDDPDGALNDGTYSPSHSRRVSKSQVYTRSQPPHAPTAASSDPIAAAAAGSSASSSSSHAAAAASASAPISAFPAPIIPMPATSEVTSISIPAAQVLKNDHVVYVVNLENTNKAVFSSWTILKRFEDFWRINQKIRAILHEYIWRQREGRMEKHVDWTRVLREMPSLPPRESKILVDHLQQRFVERRRLLLELYLRRIVAHPHIVTLDCVLDFLGCN